MELNWSIVLHPDVEQWLAGLSLKRQDHVRSAIRLLGSVGPGLGRPFVDTVTGSRHSNMKELRVGTNRLLFAFDPRRRAVVLVAGDKRDTWSRWYPAAIRLADERMDEWLSKEGRR